MMILAGISQRQQLHDFSTGYLLRPRSDGSLDVNANIGGIPAIPEGATQVITASGLTSVASTSGVYTNYTIPNGQTLTVQSLGGGSAEVTSGSIVELYYDPNGDLSVLTLIGVPLWVNGATGQISVGQEFTGNGTRRIALRRRGYTASGRDMAAVWYGYTV